MAQGVQVLVHHHQGIIHGFEFGCLMAVAVLALQPLQGLQLGDETFAQITGAHADRIHLPHQINGFTQGITAKRNAGGLGTRRHKRGTRRLGVTGGGLLVAGAGFCFRHGNTCTDRLPLQRITGSGRRYCRRGRRRDLKQGGGRFRRLGLYQQRLLLVRQAKQLVIGGS